MDCTWEFPAKPWREEMGSAGGEDADGRVGWILALPGVSHSQLGSRGCAHTVQAEMILLEGSDPTRQLTRIAN